MTTLRSWRAVRYPSPVLANDYDPDFGDTISLVSTGPPTRGTVQIGGGGTSITYTSNGLVGQETFNYTIQDNHGAQATGTVTVTTYAPALSTIQGGDGQAFGLDQYGNLWRANNSVYTNANPNQNFGAREIAVSNLGDSNSANDIVFARDANSRVWFWNQNYWTDAGGYLPSLKAGDNQVFAVGSDGQAWRFRVGGGWTASGGYGAQIDVGSKGDANPANDVVFLRSTDSRVWVWDQTSWWFTGGWLPNISAGDNQVFGVGADYQVWRYRISGNGQGWWASGGYGVEIVVSNTGDTNPLNDVVYLRNSDNVIWLWDQSTWTNLGKLLTRMAGADYQVFGLAPSGQFKRYRTGFGWEHSSLLPDKFSIASAMNDSAADDIAFLGFLDGSLWGVGDWTAERANRPPVIQAIANQSSAEGQTVSLQVVGSDPDGDILTYTADALPVGLSINSVTGLISGTLTYTSSGTYNVTVTVKDPDGVPARASLVWTVANTNRPPVANNASVTTNEDTPIGFTLSASDPDGDILSYTAFSPGHGTLTGAAPNLTYTPAANYNGSDSFAFKANDGFVDSNIATVSITINPVNDAPSFTASNPAAVNEDAGLVTVVNWATFSPGGGSDEAGQTATYLVSNIGNPALFDRWPSVDTSGTLTYTLAPNANGMSTFDVQVQDNGGTANGGVDKSSIQTLTITVNPVNDAPSFTAADPNPVDKNAGAVTVPNWATFSPGGGPDEATQTPTYTVSNVSNPGLFSVLPAVAADGTLTYTVASEVIGTSTFGVTVQDSGGTGSGGQNTSGSQTFTVTVNSGQGTPPATIFNDVERNGDRVIQARNPTLNLPGGSKRANVRIGNQPATLSIAPTAGTGSAFFDRARTQTQMNLPANQTAGITIYGGDASSAPRNMRLTVTVGGVAAATWDFTVFYVIPEAITTGTINDALPTSVTNTNQQNNQLRGMTAFTRNHQQLGFQFFDDTDPAPVAYGAIVFRGKISPAGMDRTDFNNQANRVDAFNWDRRRSTRTYRDNALFDPTPLQGPFSSNNLSDDPDDTDEDLTPFNDLMGNELYIWVVDVPQIMPTIVPQDGNIVRVRDNFTEIAYYGGVQVSQAVPWTFCVSATNPQGARTFVKETTYGTDNRLGVNDTISLTIDLQPPTVPNFTLTGFNPGSLGSSSPGTAFTIQGTNLNGGAANITQAYLVREYTPNPTPASPYPTSLVTTVIPLTINSMNIGATAIRGSFSTPAREPDNSNLGMFTLVVFIDGRAMSLANAFRLTQ